MRPQTGLLASCAAHEDNLTSRSTVLAGSARQLRTRSLFVDDILAAESISGFFGEQIFEIFFRYLGESLRNMIAAFMWPVFVIQISPPWGLGILVAMFVAFPRWIKQPLEHWLFHDDDLASSVEANN